MYPVLTKVDEKLGGVLPGGAPGGRTTLKKIAAIPGGVNMAAQEAVPAIAAGLLGIDRIISPVMASFKTLRNEPQHVAQIKSNILITIQQLMVV